MNWKLLFGRWNRLARIVGLSLLTACTQQAEKPQDVGEFIYNDYCRTCHGEAGAGTDAQTVITGREVWNKHPDTLVTTLVFGWANSGQGAGNVLRAMPPMPYNDVQIAAVAEHVMQTIGSRTVRVTEDDVRRVRAEHQRELQERLALFN